MWKMKILILCFVQRVDVLTPPPQLDIPLPDLRGPDKSKPYTARALLALLKVSKLNATVIGFFMKFQWNV